MDLPTLGDEMEYGRLGMRKKMKGAKDNGGREYCEQKGTGYIFYF